MKTKNKKGEILMNNFEMELFALLDDLFRNRQKDITGEVVKYCQKDIDIYIKLLEDFKKKNTENNGSKMSNKLLENICEGVISILKANQV